MRYNLYRCAQLNVTAKPGVSSLQAMKALEEVFATTMPAGMGYDYQGMSYQEKAAQQGVPPALIFGLSLLLVFLILAAQYESWALPISVLLGTPIAVFGAFLALFGRGLENNVYAQIGLVMLIGLLMTSFAFILGCVPLWVAVGAGAVSRQIIGTAVIGSMLAASFIAIFMVPVLFYLVERFSAKQERPAAGEVRRARRCTEGSGRQHDANYKLLINGGEALSLEHPWRRHSATIWRSLN